MKNDDKSEFGKERKYLLSEESTKKIGKYLVIVALLLFGSAALFIFIMKKNDRAQSIANQEVHDVVVEIHQEKNDVPWYRGRMGNGDWITLNRPMVYSVEIGDSIIKEKGQAYFILKKKNTMQTTKWNF